MDLSTRASLVRRIGKYLPDDAAVPQSWDELPLTVKLLVEQNDPEAAKVFKGPGHMPAELEAKVLSGDWSSDAPATRNLAAEKQAEINAILAGLPIKGQDQLEAEHQARLARLEEARRNSQVMATGRWEQR